MPRIPTPDIPDPDTRAAGWLHDVTLVMLILVLVALLLSVPATPLVVLHVVGFEAAVVVGISQLVLLVMAS